MRHGFTLIQISILLMVASLVLVNVLPAAQTKLTNDSNATASLNKMLTSLRQYQAAMGYLPCPADASQPIGSSTYGVAAANGGASGNCTGGSPAANYTDSTNHVAIGMLPVRTLGIANDNALDAYGRDITYAVDTNATSCWSSSSLTGQIAVSDNGVTYSAIARHGTRHMHPGLAFRRCTELRPVHPSPARPDCGPGAADEGALIALRVPSGKNGFTLLELSVVLVIIAIITRHIRRHGPFRSQYRPPIRHQQENGRD